MGKLYSSCVPSENGKWCTVLKNNLVVAPKATHSHHHMIWHVIPTPKEEIWGRYIYSMFTKASFPVIKM